MKETIRGFSSAFEREREFEGEESFFILFYFIYIYIYNFDDLGKCECLNYLRASYHEVKKRLEISIL